MASTTAAADKQVRRTRWLLPSLSGYQRGWLRIDVVAGLTLAAVAIPEVMGYTSIAGTPIQTGLYSVIFPTAVFALFCSSRLLVVGADSATAAVSAAGLTAIAATGVAMTPGSATWLAWSSLVALVTAAMLVVAWLLRLGFIGDFLSASVLVGFLSGVGVQVATGQLPEMLGVPKGTGNWLQQQWDLIKNLANIHWPTAAYALATLLFVLGFKRFLPRVPGALVAVVVTVIVSSLLDSSAKGVTVVGSVPPGFPPIGLPQGITWGDVPDVITVSGSCLVLIIAQSAATARSFGMKHGDRVEVNRDIAGLAGANAAAGLSGTFVVNGSPTKTEILDGQHGRTQLANLTMSAVVLVFTLFATGLLQNMPKAVLGAIVFTIGLDLISVKGMRRILAERRSEFVIALLTAVAVCVVGVQQGILLAIVLSILDLVRRQYRPASFIVHQDRDGQRSYASAAPGAESAVGLIVFRYDAELFYANASRFVDDVQSLVDNAPHPVRWLILDCSGVTNIDYSAGLSMVGLVDYMRAHDVTFVLAAPDDALLASMRRFELLDRMPPGTIYPSLTEAIAAYEALPPAQPAAPTP